MSDSLKDAEFEKSLEKLMRIRLAASRLVPDDAPKQAIHMATDEIVEYVLGLLQEKQRTSDACVKTLQERNESLRRGPAFRAYIVSEDKEPCAMEAAEQHGVFENRSPAEATAPQINGYLLKIEGRMNSDPILLKTFAERTFHVTLSRQVEQHMVVDVDALNEDEAGERAETFMKNGEYDDCNDWEDYDVDEVKVEEVDESEY